MKRKTIALMTALTLVFSLSACGDKTASQAEIPDTSSAEESTEETIEEAEVTEEESTGEEETIPEISPEEKVQSALGEMPYYGDTSKCAMTAEQATAFAQLIADGLAGDFSFRGGYYKDYSILTWGEPFYATTVNLDNVLIDKLGVILADFAGDGIPYLYLYNNAENYWENYWEIYGWKGNKAELTFEKVLNTYTLYDLYEDEEGQIKLSEESPMSMSHCISRYSFGNGTMEEIYTYSEDVLEDGNTHVMENGVETAVYTPEEYSQYNTPFLGDYVENHNHTLPYTCLYDMPPCTLEEMVNYLNVYATAMSDGQSVPVEIKKVDSSENNDNASEIEGIPEKDLQDINYSIAGNDIIYNNKTFRDLSANLDLVVSDSVYDKDTLIRFLLYTYKADEEEIFTRATHDEDVDLEALEGLGVDYNDLSVHDMMYEYPEYARLYDKYNEEATWRLEIFTYGYQNVIALAGCKSYIAVVKYGY